ncbi:MAG TPA: AAA family ATPase [Longimicrobiaceae bacterium]
MHNSLTWLHISDIHFHSETEWRDRTVRDGLLRELERTFAADDSLRPDLVFCTGDVGFGETRASPLVEQYAAARSFFDKLLAACGRDGPLPRQRLFVVPGNHDVNRKSINEDAQFALIRRARDARDHVDTINQRFETRAKEFTDAVKRLDEYAQFVRDYLPHQEDPEGRLHYARTIDIDGLRVGIAGFNSAWTCAGPDDDRTLWMAAHWQFNAASREIGNATLRIGLVHHPVGWLNEAERGVLDSRISTDFHFWLHGHEHNAWITPAQSHVVIAAGAVGAGKSEEFGFNLVRLDLATRKGTAHLRQHRAGMRGWTIAPVDEHARNGAWEFDLPTQLRGRPVPEAEPGPESEPRKDEPQIGAATADPLPPKRTVRLYGRDALLKEAVTKLNRAPFLFLYGLRGNGKTALIEELGRTDPLNGKVAVHLIVNPATTAEELFRQLAPLLGETAEFPKLPQGNTRAVEYELRQRYSDPRPAWIWLDQAHHLLDAGTFRRTDVRSLLLGLHGAIGGLWHWVLELRERPPQGMFSTIANECEVPGLNKESLRDFLADAAPIGHEEAWRYTGQNLKRVHYWLGGGRGAHPLATRLLIDVASALGETPLEVLERHRENVEQRIEERLLADLYTNVLSDPERRLLRALALYRASIPHDHSDMLERDLQLPSAWDGLERRLLLAPSIDHQHYFLHSFIAGWLRTRHLGYADPEDDDAGFAAGTDETTKQLARDLHSTIASCWLDQLQGRRRPTNVNITRALEAFHHFVAAGDAERVQDIAVELLSGNREWARERMKEFQEHLFRTGAPIPQQLAALQYRAVLDPDDHAVQRFLGECWQKAEGPHSDRAVACFEKACQLRRDYPHYWANLGKALLARGPADAADFLSRLELLEKDCPEAINDYVRAIQFDCLRLVGDTRRASAQRMAEIEAGSRHPAFYNDEAKARLDRGDTAGALEVLDLAEQREGANDFTRAIRASVLQRSDPAAASALRMAEIEAGSRHPAFYNDEAKARLDRGDTAGALEVLDLAERRGCASDFTRSIRASVLQRSDPAAASVLRMAEIEAGSRNPVFYADEAKARLDRGDTAGALEVLDLAEQRGCANEFTRAIRASILQRTDPGAASALRMAEIEGGSRDPVFYADEAKARLDRGDTAGALEVLDLAEQRGCADDYIRTIRANAVRQ